MGEKGRVVGRMTEENAEINARQVVGGLERNIWKDEKELRNLQRNLKL